MSSSLAVRLLPFALVLAPPAATQTVVAPPLGLRFTENLGQEGDAARFSARVGGAKVLFETGAMVLQLPELRALAGAGAQLVGAPPRAPVVPAPGAELTFRFAGADAAARVTGRGLLPGIENVYSGPDASRWRSGLHAFGALDYDGLWPGIALAVGERDGALHYDVLVEPGADVGAFALAVEGSLGLFVDADGALVAQTVRGAVRMTIPAAWDEAGATRMPVSARFVLREDGLAGLSVRGHDPARRLVVDPGLDIFAIFGAFGGFNLQWYSVAVDPATSFPVMCGYNGSDAQLYCYDLDLDVPVWLTTIAGPGTEAAIDLCYDAAGDVYVSGLTDSIGLPTTPGVFQPFAPGLGDAFVAHLGPAGGLIALTYLGSPGGSEANNTSIDIGPNGLITVAGSTDSPGFPIAPVGLVFDPTYNGGGDAWIMQLPATLVGFVRSTFYGGALAETVGFGGVRVGPDNSVYIGGWTDSPAIPLAAPFDPIYGGATDAFLAHLTPTLGGMIFSTYRGGAFLDAFNGIDVDDTGAVWGAGYTASPAPGGIGGVFGPPLDFTYNGGGDVFLTKHTGGGVWQWGTFRGGDGSDSAMRVVVDRYGRATWTGLNNSGVAPFVIPYPTTPTATPVSFGGYDAFIDQVGPNGTLESYASYVNILSVFDDSCSGLALNARGDAYVAGALNVFGAPISAPLARVTFPWLDEGNALPGTTTPQLMGDGTLAGGLPMELRLSSCVPGSVATLVVGFVPLFVPFQAGILVPAPNLLITGLVVPPSGEVVLGAAWPFGVPAGTAIFMQAWIPDALGPSGFAASNGVSTDTP